jgi:hypothetical protein
MKLHNLLLTLTAVGTLCSACGSDDPQQTATQIPAGTALQLSSLSSSAEGSTTDINQGDLVGITLWDDATGTTYTLNQKLVATDGGRLMGEEDITMPAGATSLSIFAYVPYREEWSSNVSYRRVEVSSDQSTYDEYHNSDLLIGLPEGGNPVQSPNVKLTFSHVMSRINIELTDPTEKVGLSAAAVKITDVLTSAFVNPYTGEVTTIEGQKGSVLTYRTLNSSRTRSDRRETMSAIIPSQTIEAGASFIEINVNSTKYKFGLPETLYVAQGADYNYSLELTGDVITLVSSSVSAWQGNTETDVYADTD